MVRLFSVAMALLAGLLAVFLLDLALGATGTLAQEKENCPPGFFWERLSGIGCVQDRSTLPGHGKIGYDGTSICEDGYSGAYEHRETTDGEPAPGTPYVNFAFLTACNGAAAAPAATTGGGGGGGIGGVARDAAEQLYDGGGGPSMGDLAVVGIGFGAGWLFWSWGTGVLGAAGGPGVLGAGVGGPTGVQTAEMRRKEYLDKLHADWLKEEYLLHDEIVKARAELRELERQLKAKEKVLNFWSGGIRYHYWKRIPAFASLGISVAALTLLGLMLRPEITIATWKKLLLASSAGSLMYSKASYPAEEAKLIAKIKPMVNQLRTKVWQKKYQVQALEKEMQRIRNEAAVVRKEMRG